MKILICCESSGTVRDAFRAKGHDAYSCDLLPADDNSPFHIQGDCREAVGSGNWDMFGFHPPCTYLSVSGMHWTARGLRDPKLTEDALDLVRWMMEHDQPFYLENPVSIISSRIRKPDQIVQPYQFGHDASKKTCLWLNKLAPLPLDPEKFVAPRITADGKERWGNQCDKGQSKIWPGQDRWKTRSKTYSGIALAMAWAWG